MVAASIVDAETSHRRAGSGAEAVIAIAKGSWRKRAAGQQGSA
jgi:hypothetical protein